MFQTPKSTHISRIRGLKKPNYRNKVNYFDLQSPLDLEKKGKKKILQSLTNPEDDFVLNFAKVEADKINATEEKPWQLNSNSKKIVKSQNEEIQATTQESEVCDCKEFADARLPEELSPCTVYPEQEIHNFSSDLDKGPNGLVTLVDSPQNEENSKAFMGSIGSWINEFFSAQNKCSSPQISEVDEILNKSVVEEDAEYLKSINAIKEQFKKKLKSETSIQVSTPDEPFIFNFEKVLDSGKKQSKTAKTTQSTATSWIETLKEFDAQIPELSEKSGRLFNSNPGELIIRTNNQNCSPPTGTSRISYSSMIENKSKKNLKNKPRYNLPDLEDFSYSRAKEPLKRPFLAATNEDKSLPLGVQEAQTYGARKSRSKQLNARCYTTNANRTDTIKCSQVDTKGLSQFYGHNMATRKEIDEILRKKSMSSRKGEVHRPARKEFSEATSDSMTCMKRKSSKNTGRIPIEPTKIESKKSDELVKVLMKKVKTTRSHNLRSKSTNSQVSQTPYMMKNKIMQSATSALVNLLAKRDNMLPAKVYDGKMYSGKELVVKSTDSRFDISRTLSGSKFNRLSYLLDDNKAEDDALFAEKAQRKTVKREESEDIKKLPSKLTKRKEVEHMFSKIDEKFVPSHLWVAKQKEKKFVIQSALETLSDESKDLQLARFQRQHQLFKTNMKTNQQMGETPQISKEEINSPANTSPSTELAVVDANYQLQSVSNQEKNICYEGDETYSYPAEFDHNFTEEVTEDPAETEETESPRQSGRKIDSSPLSKEKFKKAIQFQKDSQTSELLTPLEKLYISVHQKEEPPESGAGDSNTGKSDVVSKKYYLSTANESSQNLKCLPCASLKSGLYLTESKKEVEKKEKTKRVSTPKSEKKETTDESLELY